MIYIFLLEVAWINSKTICITNTATHTVLLIQKVPCVCHGYWCMVTDLSFGNTLFYYMCEILHLGNFFLNSLIFLNYFIYLIEILVKFKAHLVFHFVSIPKWPMCVVQSLFRQNSLVSSFVYWNSGYPSLPERTKCIYYSPYWHIFNFLTG